MTRAEIDAFLARHRAAFDSRNARTLAESHAPAGTFYSPASGTVVGRENIQKVYEYWLSAFPDLEFTWDQPIVEGDRLALFWRFRGTVSGTFFGDVKPGVRVEFRGAADYQ